MIDFGHFADEQESLVEVLSKVRYFRRYHNETSNLTSEELHRACVVVRVDI